jgi:membrane glycosyltransferase
VPLLSSARAARRTSRGGCAIAAGRRWLAAAAACRAIAWTLGVVAGALTALALLLVAHLTSAVVVGLVVAPVVGVVVYRALVARAIKQLRPTLATTVGELPAPERTFDEFPAAPRARAGVTGLV